MHLRKIFCALILFVAQVAIAAELTPIDLKPFVGYSPFDIIKADWLLPRGEHVYDGVPWKIDGAILLYANNGAQKKNPARTNINDIAVGQKFEVLNLLAAAQQNSPDGTTIAKIHLNYADGTESALDVKFGEHVRYYIGPWHRRDKPLKDKSVHQAWHAQFGPSANHDEYLRLFHVPLTNPNPAKLVRTISLESTKKNAALILAAMTVGPANAKLLPNDPIGKAPFPDFRPRHGDLETGQGDVFTGEGKPVVGATVKVIAAREYKSGELREHDINATTATDSAGHFALTNLSDAYAYRVLIFADGFIPYVFHGLDAKSDPPQIRLTIATNRIGKFAARARVVDLDGKPIRLAQIEREGVGYDGGTTWGGRDDVTEYAVSNTNGEFVLSSDSEFTRVQANVTAPGMAPVKLWIPVTNNVTTIEMGIGATIRGRVLDLDGKPLTNVTVGISGQDRNSEVYAGDFSATTGSNGVFSFEHVPPRTSWQLFGKVNSFKRYGALAMRTIMSGGHAETNDLGELRIKPGLRLAGYVKTRNGEPIPNGFKIDLGFEDAWDYVSAPVAKDGRFEFDGIYPAKISMSFQKDGWKFSGRNVSLSLWNPWELFGTFEKNKTNLVLLIEKGNREYSYENGNGSLPPADDISAKEISGVENEGASIILAGTVVDDTTGKPISKCKIVPGYKASAAALGYSVTQPQQNIFQKLLKPLAKKQPNWWDRPCWMIGRAEDLTNGSFSIPFVPLQSTPMLRIEANGYEPFITDPIASGTNNMVIRLSRGNGPSGVVLTPDGKPAEKADVLFAAGSEQNGFEGRGLHEYSGTKHVVKTKADGAFSFMARGGEARLFVAHETGYAEEPVKEKGGKLQINLKPWAVLSGTLINPNGTPAVGVELGLTFYDEVNWDSRQPLLHYGPRSKTDSKGSFLFTNVPPRRVQVQRIIRSSGGGWSSILQTWTDAEPGITNDVGKVTYDSPPAKPVLEQLKEKFGLQ